MARMYPNQLDPSTESAAERLLYEAFRDELDNTYTVFHSVKWQSKDKEGRPRDGESDFVIAHPQRGILVMEVKGGAIRHDPYTGDWTSTSRGGRVNDIRDPFVQARYSKYTLQDQLSFMLRRPPHQVNIGHAVAFPDAVVRDELYGPDQPREIILDATGLANLSGWVGQVLSYYRGSATQRDTAPGTKAVQALMELLGKRREFRPALWGDLVQEQQQLIRLTEQQYQILDTLNWQRRAAICGCAGSGKTMLAAEKASRLARQGFQVLFTCFNTNLARDLRLRLRQPPNLDVVHFHGLCTDLAKQAHTLPVNRDKEHYYDQQLPDALMRAIDRVDLRYDAVIVDEGQDFLEDWWIPLQMLLRDPDGGILYIFYDDNQRIYERHGAFPIAHPPYPLTVNCRNTQAIHQTVLGFYDGGVQPSARGPQGRPVEVVRYGRTERVAPAVRDVLEYLTGEEKIPSDEIAILTPRSTATSRLWEPTAVRVLRLTENWPAEPGQFYCTSIYRFKGLERAVIILAEIEEPWLRTWTDLDQLLYVGCSRARNHLIVLLSDEADPELEKAFAGAATLRQ